MAVTTNLVARISSAPVPARSCMRALVCTEALGEWLGACSLADKERDELQSQLADFPHHCQQDDLQQLTRPHLRRVQRGLESALSVGYSTELETARARNLLAYTLYRQGRPQKALQELARVQRNNLVTLANTAVILHSQQQLSQARDQVRRLTDLQEEDPDFAYLLVCAKAELAFAYTRFGPGFSKRAIALFEEVLETARESEKWLWSFGMALTKRRALRTTPQVYMSKPSEKTVEEQRNVLELLMTIVQKCPSPSLKAKAYAEIALLLHMVSRTRQRNEFYFEAQMDPLQACNIALQLDGNDNSVLCKAGRILRYNRETDRSRDLLEKAVRTRPSSTAYHHLGITYKSMAARDKHRSNQDTSMHAQGIGSRRMYQTMSQQLGHGAAGSSTNNRGRPLESEDTSGNRTRGTLSHDRDARNIQKKIKSPPYNKTRFSRTDRYVEDALRNFEKALEFSEGENTRAQQDLALLQRALGEMEEAKNNLLAILNHHAENMFAVDEASIYEQLGVIMKEQAEAEEDERKKTCLEQDGSDMLLRALKVASRIYTRSSGVSIGEVFHSFPILMREAEATSARDDWKLKEKAKLCQLIRDHKQSLELLEEIERMNSKESTEPEHLKLCIENYVAMGEYLKASTFLDLLECTSLGESTRRLFEDKQFILKLHLNIALNNLQHNSAGDKKPFREAFLEAMNEYPADTSSTECSSTDNEANDVEKWDVGIVHDDDTREDAIALAKIMGQVFGLKVPIMDRDAPPNRPELQAELTLISNSSLVVVLAGGKMSKKQQLMVDRIAKRPTTVTLLVKGQQVPKLLKARRTLDCTDGMMAALRQAASTEGEPSQCQAEHISKLFCFLVDVKDMEP